MKIVKILSMCSSLGILLLLANDVYAFGLSDIAGAVETLHAGQPKTVTVPSATTGKDLTGSLMQQLGVTQSQAEGGAGAIFQLAKSKMPGTAFSELSHSVPNMQGLLAAAPVIKAVNGGNLGGIAGGLQRLIGNSGGAAGNLIGLVSSFQQLGLSPDMMQKFVPLVVQYVQGNGGGSVTDALQSALMGGKL